MRGGGAPHHNPKARGAFIGMGLNNHYGHYSRAVMEGIAFGLREMVEIFNVPFTEVRMAGGGRKIQGVAADHCRYHRQEGHHHGPHAGDQRLGRGAVRGRGRRAV